MKKMIILIAVYALSVQSFATTQADNTKVNVRDRSSTELTADQQKNNSSDLDITRKIRQDIMKESDFSTYAQNVKIITVAGNVTLKGPVSSASEQTRVLEIARQVAGAANVTDEISIAVDKNKE